MCVCSYSGTIGYEVTYERYQWLQNYESVKSKKVIFLKRTVFKRYAVKTSEKANMDDQHWLSYLDEV
jgi:hypothetical protein